MLKMPDTKVRYFSVTHSTKIQGVRYTPSVCYPLSPGLQAAVEEMAACGMARIYADKVRFVTGAAYPVKKPETGTAAPQPASAPEARAGVQTAVKKSPAAAEKPGRKSGRGAYTAQTGREFD
jgi:hypothetical protein